MSPDPPHEFAYRLTDELHGRAVVRAWQTHFGWRFVLMLALYALLLLLLSLVGGSVLLIGIFTGAGLIVAVLVLGMFGYARWQGRRLIAKLADRSARCRLDANGVQIENGFGSSRFAWAMLERVVLAPDVWLLFYGRSQYFALPADGLDGEPGAYVRERIAEAGGKVVDLR